MSLEVWRRLVRVATSGSISRAAESLLLPQSALSRQIQELEQEIGRPLFVRTSHGVTPTTFGERVLYQVRSLLQVIDSTQASDCPAEGILRIGASLASMHGFLPEVLVRFRRRFPGHEPQVWTSYSGEVYRAVWEQRVEVGLVTLSHPQEGIVLRPLCQDRLFLVAPRSHPLAAREAVTVAELRDEPLILPPTYTALRQDVEALFAACGVVPRITFEVNNIDIIQRLVHAGVGTTVLPFSYHRYRRALRAVLIKFPDELAECVGGRVIATIHREDAPLSYAAENWVAICHEVGRQLSAGQAPWAREVAARSPESAS